MTDYVYPPVEVNPAEVKQRFNEFMEVEFPGWQPDPTELDDRLGFFFAQEAATLNETLSDAATSIFRWFGAEIAGVPPIEAKSAKGLTTWVFSNETHEAIPVGTALIFVDATGKRQTFETTAEIAKNVKEAKGVPIQAVIPGAEGNEITGTASELVTPFNFIVEVKLQEATSEGLNAETDAAYLARLRQEFRTLTPKPILPEDFTLLSLEEPNIGRATTIAGWSPTAEAKIKGDVKSTSAEVLKVSATSQLAVGTEVTGSGIPAKTTILSVGTESFVMTAAATETKAAEEITAKGTLRNGGRLGQYVANDKGEALTAPEMTKLEENIQAKCLTGVVFTVGAPTFTEIEPEVVVYAWPGQNEATVKAAVEEALKNYISPENWGRPPTGQANVWTNDTTVRLVNVEHVVLGVIGTHYVAELKLNGKAEDVKLSGVTPLPKLKSPKVTVHIG